MATIYGTNGADELLRGTNSADAIYGFWGDDRLEGVQGRDFLFGGNGNDTLDGGAGQDVIDGEGGFDLALYSGKAPVWADLRTGIVTFPGEGLPEETLLNVEAIDGGGGADRFIGNGAGNRFWGSTGADTLIGNIGSDTLLGGAGADSLDGGNGQDSLIGGFGNDTMRGGLHDDIFSIGPITKDSTGDTIGLVDYGKDLIDGGGGTDTLLIDGPTGHISSEPWVVVDALPVRANLNLGTLRIGDSNNHSTLVSIENIETGSGDDSINGSTGDNLIRAGNGANVVYAGAGDDTIIGGSETNENGRHWEEIVEVLNGGDGNDAIYGMGSQIFYEATAALDEYPGQDILAGGAGNDTLYGGPAFQTMSGGAGQDVFVLTGEYASDRYGTIEPSSLYMPPTTITDFERGTDTIQFTFEAEFIGRADTVDLEVGEFGYHRSGADTIVEARFDSSTDDFSSIFTITLSDYTGPLSASDFDLG